MIKISRNAVGKSLLVKKMFFFRIQYKIKLKSVPIEQCRDNLCKKEFDIYRKKKTPPLFFKKYNIDAIPFDHPEIDIGVIIEKGFF